jgi:hypothetical protein
MMGKQGVVYINQVVRFSECIPCGAAGLSVVWAEWNLIVYIRLKPCP